MEIALLRTGGIIPLQKKAREEVSWGEEEIQALIDHIKIEGNISGNARDSTQYQLIYNNKPIPIDIEKVPLKYKEVFERLKDNLKIVKPG